MAHDVFVSYANEDKATADALVAALEQHQIRCWIAPRDVLPGQDYAAMLIDAIGDAQVMVLVFSANANNSPHVMREVERAASKGSAILPLRIEDVEPSRSMEFYISSTHWLDAMTPPLQQHLERLTRSVAALLDAASGVPGTDRERRVHEQKEEKPAPVLDAAERVAQSEGERGAHEQGVGEQTAVTAARRSGISVARELGPPRVGGPSYPAVLDIERPQKFERPQIVAVLIILTILGSVISWIVGLVYLAFPVIAVILISQKGGEKYLEEDGPRVTGWVRRIVAVYAYLGILADKVPTGNPEEIVRYEVTTGGSPTVGSALLRLIYSIPSVFVLGILGIASAIILLIAAIMVLISENYPDGLFNFQRGILRWVARLLAYHASLVGEYPPFALDMGTETKGTPPAEAPHATESAQSPPEGSPPAGTQ